MLGPSQVSGAALLTSAQLPLGKGARQRRHVSLYQKEAVVQRDSRGPGVASGEWEESDPQMWHKDDNDGCAT